MTPEIEDPELTVVVECSPKFQPLYKLGPDVNVVVLIGGRGGMKTYEASKLIAYKSTMDKKRIVVLRDEKELIRESILNEVLLRYDTANEDGLLSTMYERLDTGIKDRESNEMVVFTKGFRASTSAKKSNLKSISNVDIAVIEEAEDIRDVDKFNTFHDSIRKEGSLIIIILNTPDINHWIIKRYFNCIPAKDDKGNILDGYYEVVPKVIKGFMCIQTSFEDNEYLPQHVKDRYRAYGNPNDPSYNPFYYYTAIKGYASTGRKGQILKNVKSIKLKDYLDLPFKEVYGQDFGTASPAGMIGAKFFKNNCYFRELNYLPKDALALGKMYSQLKFGDADKIVGDSAEPETIKKINSGWKDLPPEEYVKYPLLKKGFYMVEALKGPGSIKTGISFMTSMNLFCVEESANAWNEIYNWIYAVDKNKNPTDEPVDDFNHLMDPLRYVIVDHKGMPKKLQAAYFR